MKDYSGLPAKERKRRQKIAAAFQRRRMRGYKEWLKKKHKEMAEREREKKREKEREKRLREKEKHKKRPGRPRKPGPKKKRRPKKVPKFNKRNQRPPYLYKIISCRNGKQVMFIGKYRTIQEAYDKLKELQEAEKSVVFPNTNAAEGLRRGSAIYEYVLIEKNDDESTVLRNEYGKLVEHKTNLEGWSIIDKIPQRLEETFSVWGYDFRSERKTFKWVYERLLEGLDTKLDYKRVILYKNKVIFKEDDGYIDIIFCKCTEDSIKMYNLLEEWVKRDKIKQVLFLGSFNQLSEKRRALEDQIMEMTGWTRKKVQMDATTYYQK